MGQLSQEMLEYKLSDSNKLIKVCLSIQNNIDLKTKDLSSNLCDLFDIVNFCSRHWLIFLHFPLTKSAS